ncbi:MAG: 4a-hydroxytetrahydrobiopterin dehydratase, partial [Acidobacteria bacterium]|nr:4a-hydroxytetrahydrobiopterin dehydratase [Acidobacteriota bacterium]
MSELAKQQCVPCRGGVPPLRGDELKALQAQLGGGWTVVDGHHLEKAYAVDDFRQALDFTVRVGEMAEEQDHHPAILLTWGRVTVTIGTHKIDG